MNTRIFILLAGLVAICFAGQRLYAQYPGQTLPGYGQPAPAIMPMSQPGLVPAPRHSMLGPGAMVGQPSMGVVPAHGQFGAPAAFIPASPALAPRSQVIPAAAHGPVQGGGKCEKCKGGGKGSCCNSAGYDQRWAVYGEFLFLRARDSEVAFAVAVDGPVVAPPVARVEVGPVAVADMDYQPGFLFGVALNADDCTQLTLEYTMFESGTTENISTSAPFVITSLVQHPSVTAVGSDFLQATGQYDITHDVVDVGIHRIINYSDQHQLAWMAGSRYWQHEQNFAASFAGTGTENVTTDIDFYGMGARGGLEFENYIGCQWATYANAYAGLLAGEFKASYVQSQSFDTRVVNTTWKAGRIVTNLDLELGASRVSRCGNYRLNLGYVYSGFFNVIQTDEWIRGVHTNDFIGMDSGFTLDGIVGRFEARY